jgi:hypothetical protein
MNASKVFCETKTEGNQLSAHPETRNRKDHHSSSFTLLLRFSKTELLFFFCC